MNRDRGRARASKKESNDSNPQGGSVDAAPSDLDDVEIDRERAQSSSVVVAEDDTTRLRERRT